MNIQPVVLTGKVVRLEPLGLQHVGDLAIAADHDEIWTYLDEPTPGTPAAMQRLIQDALDEQGRGVRIPFAIIDVTTGRAVGSTSYIDIRPRDRAVEIGWTWMTPSQWRTGSNAAAKLLLLRHAFESQNAGRVAIKTDLRNVRSQKAIERLGATREGVWRNHRILSDGSYRHTVYYSVIDSEWPTVQDRIVELTARYGVNANE
ncbi:GNAT family N-acetyltransferase [Actinoplanes sp. HUAS TT8]|uniref:GNAT family N-acetyltransferase n=1 Tax=Actinoplanes sp. HUAS TT8 TaxID=3447453 RepID=UPI003F5210BB